MQKLIYFGSHHINPIATLRSLILQTITMVLMCIPLNVNAAFSSHSTSIVSSITCNYGVSIGGVSHNGTLLTNPTEDSFYYSGTKTDASLTSRVFIRTKLNSALDPDDKDDLVVYLRRAPLANENVNNAQPVAFEVKGVYTSGNNLYSAGVLFRVYFQYRGPLTHEYSTRIPIAKIFEHTPSAKSRKIEYLEFVAVTNANDGLYASRSNGIRDVALNSFDVLKIPHTAPYSDLFEDRFHLRSDYGTGFESYEFVNTRGIADSRNTIEGWEMLNDAEIARLDTMGITYPDYSFITSESDKIRNPYPLETGQKRQATHTVEHTIYAMPGDIVPLYPYYGLSHTKNFKENFSHWYDYKTGRIPEYTTPWSGENVRLLDFLVDPSKVQKASQSGYYGGEKMNIDPSKIFRVSSAAQYVQAVNAVNNGTYDACIELIDDIDFTGIDGNELILCPDWQNKFSGVLNGNGHRISNLIVNKPGTENVGLLIGWTNPDVVIENLYIDNTCSVTGKRNVGLVGFHAEQRITVRNLHTEASVKAVNGQAAGIVGTSDKAYNSIVLQDCYIGGVIGIDGQSENAAIVGWWNTYNGVAYSSLINVVVNCELHGSDSNANRKYIRANCTSESLVDKGDNIRGRGFFSFKDCYGNLDKNDAAWNFIPARLDFPASYLAKLGWTDYKTPPMSATVSNPYSNTITIGNEQDYINKINSFNANTYTDERVNIVLTQDLDFKDYGPDEVPMITPVDNKEFAGIFNGAGHTIRNLRIIRDEENVGMFARTRNGARIENLILDSGCLFQGRRNVGIVGNHRWNPIIFRNVKTEATVRGTAGGEQACAAIVGFSNGGYSEGTFNLTNIYIGGIVGNPADVSSGHNNAVICGWQTENRLTGTLSFSNIVVDCELYGCENRARRKYMRHPFPDNAITMDGETYVRTCSNNESKEFSFRYTNCYGNIDPAETPWQLIPEITDETFLPEFDHWKDCYVPDVVGGSSAKYALKGERDRTVGTVATFFYPKDPFAGSGAQSLPLEPGMDEYVIAADFSQTYDPERNVDYDSRQLFEPIIAFRHIFRIRDGKKFADMVSGSVESNHNYLRKTRKYVSARAQERFQIRLDNPIPKKNGNRLPPSHYYYVDADGEYRQVANMKINVLDADTRKPSLRMSFKFDNIYPGYGYRDIEGVRYALGEGYYTSDGLHPDYDDDYKDANESEYYLMLANSTVALRGHYLVQIVAQDYDGNTINIAGTSTPLVLMEYDITIMPTNGAWMVDQNKLYTQQPYMANTPEELDKKYSAQSVKIDFDEYMAINSLPDSDPLKTKLISRSTYVQENSYTSKPGPDAPPTSNGIDKTWFKWPVPWQQSTYIFGYNDRFDYSMYQIASHSDNVVWKWSAKNFPESSDPKSLTGNNPGDGTGLFDRRYYASKRDNTRSADPQQGYFYYVNAASDPGVLASLRIDEICQGSRVVVSAWMAEFSSVEELGNISFNFVAVLKDNVEQLAPTSGFVNGQRIIMHQYISGYPSTSYRGQWLNIYYSFLPRLAEFSSEGVTPDMVDHYELQLDNNSRSSNGADYAVDDIRAYVVPPTSEVKQLYPACDDSPTRLKISSYFYTLLELAHMPEATGDDPEEELKVCYSILDKEIFDDIESKGGSYQSAFDASLVKFDNHDGKHYGTVLFKSKYISNPEYSYNAEEVSEYGFREDLSGGDRTIVFETEIDAGTLRPGKTYYLIMKSPIDDDLVDGQEYLFFDKNDRCANVSEVYIIPSAVVKIDGVVTDNLSDYYACTNQQPVIQVNIMGMNDDSGEMKPAEKNAHIDWFYGTLNQFEAIHEKDNEEHTLKDALHVFRSHYPEAMDLTGVEVGVHEAGKDDLEQWMVDLIASVIVPEEGKSIPRLTLYSSSFVMPPIEFSDASTEGAGHVVAIPAKVDYGSFIICTSPTQLELKARRSSPVLMHGLTGIDYPEDLVDVPLRIGIDQLRTEYFSPSSYKKRRIDIPVRKSSSSDAKTSRKLNLITESVHQLDEYKNKTELEKLGAVILVQTNDPAYKDLGTLDKSNDDIGTLLWVGDVSRLDALTNKNDAIQYFQVEFDEDFSFKEGYFYRFRFQYAEDGSEGDDGICNGQDVFTLKVVPKYLVWTGEENLNWNNDGNWQRVSSSDLMLTTGFGGRAPYMAHYITNGSRGSIVNANKAAYAPLDFTHVIIQDGVESPFLYRPSVTMNGIGDAYDASVTYIWPLNPEKGDTGLQDDDPGRDVVGRATGLINYDMAAFEFGESKGRNDAEVGCRPWYANTCREIHFKPGGTVMNQQELTYRKAWVDVELDHSRWYTVASPIQEVYAGDFYLPSDGARQETELFQDIYFDNSLALNHRFKPAVYQRGWDKGVANVYELDSEFNEVGSPRNVAVKTFWSHVYNDVDEQYGNGTGFSIKTDVSDMTLHRPATGGKVLFRLPKADSEYTYFTADGLHSGHKTEIIRTDSAYRLNPSHGVLKALTAAEGKYFLIGNPFMTHLDVRKFLKANSDLLSQKYWVVTERGQIAGSLTDTDVFVADPSEAGNPDYMPDPTVIAPMQGFFVEAKTAARTIELKYDESMMRRYAGDGSCLTLTTRGGDGPHALRITAYAEGIRSSAALLVEGEASAADNDAVAFDNRDLDVPATVYTVRDGRALAIGFADDAEGIEIGVIADRETRCVLRFEGVAHLEGLSLLDKADGSLTPIEEGMEVAFTGPAADRFFITAGVAGEGIMSGIEWNISGRMLRVRDNAASGLLEVKVFDTLGRLVSQESTLSGSVGIELPDGVYVVEMITPSDMATAKIRM